MDVPIDFQPETSAVDVNLLALSTNHVVDDSVAAVTAAAAEVIVPQTSDFLDPSSSSSSSQAVPFQNDLVENFVANNTPTSIVAENGETFTYTGECFQRDGHLFMVLLDEKGQRVEMLYATEELVVANDAIAGVDIVNDNSSVVTQELAPSIKPENNLHLAEQFLQPAPATSTGSLGQQIEILPETTNQISSDILIDNLNTIVSVTVPTTTTTEPQPEFKPDLIQNNNNNNNEKPISPIPEPLMPIIALPPPPPPPPPAPVSSKPAPSTSSLTTATTSSSSLSSSTPAQEVAFEIKKTELQTCTQPVKNNPVAHSSKTFSKTSNIVWLQIPEKNDTVKKKLTTTIELADPDVSASPPRNFEYSPKKINIITNNDINKLVTPPKTICENVKFTTTSKEMISINFVGTEKPKNEASSEVSQKNYTRKPNQTSSSSNDLTDLVASKQPKPAEKVIISVTNGKNDSNKKKVTFHEQTAETIVDQQEEPSSKNNEQKMKNYSRRPFRNWRANKNDDIADDEQSTPEKNNKIIDDHNTNNKRNNIDSGYETVDYFKTPPKKIPKFNFKEKEHRNSEDYCDLSVNKRFSVSFRIQPHCRDERSGPIFHCEHCCFQSSVFEILKMHQNSCSPSLSTPSFSSSSSSSLSTTTAPKNTNNIDSKQTKSMEVIDQKKQIKKPEKIPAKPLPVNLDGDGGSDVLNGKKEDGGNINNDDDDDEEEPETVKNLDGFYTNDVVWVKTKAGSWPALIIDILSAEKRLLLRLINCPVRKESLKTFTKSVVSFDKPSVDKYLKESKKSGHHNKLLKVVQKVEDYLRKRCLGTDVNPAAFFNFIEYFESNRLETPNSTLISKKDSNKESDTKKNQDKSIDGESLFQFIKDGNVEAYLRNIYNETIDNERHKNFVEKDEIPDKNIIEKNICFAPITDEKQQDELVTYLSKLYETCVDKSNDDKVDSKILPYIYSVWIPEAIIKAISKKKNIVMKKAEETYQNECSGYSKSKPKK